MNSARHITVTGIVHGVGFRYACRQRARMLGVSGWVCNADNGTVEIHAEGADDALDALIAWCHDGPPGAHVRDVHVNPAAASQQAGADEVRF